MPRPSDDRPVTGLSASASDSSLPSHSSAVKNGVPARTFARALTMDHALMPFDEPTSAPGPERVGQVLLVMREQAEAGMTSILVTDELGFARPGESGTVP
jgi:ABC-type histidine transport system ATPase subunit